jgi:hypothetical protein
MIRAHRYQTTVTKKKKKKKKLGQLGYFTEHGGRSPPKDGHQKVLNVFLDDKTLQELNIQLEFWKGFINNDAITDQGPNEGARVPMGTGLVVKREPVRQVHGRAEQEDDMT